MKASRWLHGIRSPSGVMHLRHFKAQNARTLCGAAAIGTRDGYNLWRWYTTWRPPTCQRCRRIARRRYGV